MSAKDEIEMLEEQTLQYWEVSQVWNGVSKKRLTTMEALYTLRKVIMGANPTRPVAQCADRLKHAIIVGNPRTKRTG